jgi:hypothetical protein
MRFPIKSGMTEKIYRGWKPLLQPERVTILDEAKEIRRDRK